MEVRASIYLLQVWAMVDNCWASSCSYGHIYRIPNNRSSLCDLGYHTDSNHYHWNCHIVPSRLKYQLLEVDNNYFYRSRIFDQKCHICDDLIPNNLCLFDDDSIVVNMVRMDQVFVVL